MKKVIFAVLAAISFSASAACDQFYPNEKKIEIPNTIELCNTFFVTVYDPAIKSPVFSSALVKAVDVQLPREGSFKSDKRIPGPKRAELGDYIGSKMDKGHLVPAADGQSEEEIISTSVLSNAAPQSPKLNRGQWRKLESFARKHLTRDTIVLTGVIIPKNAPTIGRNKIPVPSHFYKVIYNNKPSCFIADNVDGASVRVIKCDALSAQVGFKL